MILCCGEALVDMIPTPTVNGAEGYVPHVGGAIFNTAIALGRLGVRTGMVSGLSSDLFGQQLKDALSASHVDISMIMTSDRPTTLAFVRLTDGHATYSFYDENSAGCMVSVDDMPVLSGASSASIASEVSALYFGGISLACEPGANAYAAFLEREGNGRAVMLDPNIRPGFIQDINRYRARLEHMIGLSDIVKVSDEDLNWLVPSPLSLQEKIESLLRMGPPVVVLTRGSEGATGYLRDGTEVHISAVSAEIADTVGAGDTFNAGLMAKLSELGQLRKSNLRDLSEDALRQSLAHGARVAAVTVTRVGANPPWAGEL